MANIYGYTSLTLTSGDTQSSDDASVNLDTTLDKQIIQNGIEIAIQAKEDLDLGLYEISGSSEPRNARITKMLNNVGAKRIFTPWHAAAVTTWFKEAANVPTPPVPDSATADGWMKWAKSTNRWSKTPIVGAAVVYGTVNPIDNSETAVNIGVVSFISEENNLLVTEVDIVTLQGAPSFQLAQKIANPEYVLGFVLPCNNPPKARKFDPKKDLKGIVTDQNQTGIHYFDNQIVFQQYKAPWSNVRYGPVLPQEKRANLADNLSIAVNSFNLTDIKKYTDEINKLVSPDYTTVSASGCGLCVLASILRLITGNEKINPGYLAVLYGEAKRYVSTELTKEDRNKGTDPKYYKTIAEQFNCSIANVTSKEQAINVFQRSGYLIVVGRDEQKQYSHISPFGSGGHYFYLRKYDSEIDAFYIGNSTLFGCTQPYTWDQLKKYGMTAAYSIIPNAT